ncbi:MAG: type I restriction enzyme HsdR N-terminal domain-containing protein, partial [Cyclobacteriaceae bacterium]
NTEGKPQIFDPIRKKFVVLTPEEWVRQHLINYLTSVLGYPKSLIKVESSLKYNKLSKRSDIMVYDRTGAPFIVIECKAPTVVLGPEVFEQASVYNKSKQAKYISVSNGLKHYCCEIDHKQGSYRFLSGLPEMD